jgi:phosphoenolpyruvate carboxykinase (GTP)
MLPFCGYNMADYWGHWLKIGEFTTADKLPRIYSVNWFRKNADGKFIWPGFGENARVLEWIVNRLSDSAEAVDTPIGRIPAAGALDTEGLGLSDTAIAELFAVDSDSWLAETDLTEAYYAEFGDRVPAELTAQLGALRQRLNNS